MPISKLPTGGQFDWMEAVNKYIHIGEIIIDDRNADMLKKVLSGEAVEVNVKYTSQQRLERKAILVDSNRVPWALRPSEREALEASFIYNAKCAPFLKKDLKPHHGLLCPKVLFVRHLPQTEADWSDVDDDVFEIDAPSTSTTVARPRSPYTAKMEPQHNYPPYPAPPRQIHTTPMGFFHNWGENTAAGLLQQ